MKAREGVWSNRTFESLGVAFRLARPRTWVFAVSAYLFGYATAYSFNPWMALQGSLVFALLTAATNLLNAHTDRIEDSFNQPMRMRLLDKIGRRGLISAILGSYVIASALAIPFGYFFHVIFLLAMFDSVFYSARPLRFKKHPVTGLIAFSGAVGLPYLAGHTLSGSFDITNPIFIMLTYFMLSYGTLKNLPDYFGDKAAGIVTTATVFNGFRTAVKATAFILSTPYALILAFVLIRLLSYDYLILIPFLTIPIFLSGKALNNPNPANLERLHTYGFFYAFSFILLVFLVTYPTLGTVFTLAALYAFVISTMVSRVDSRKPLVLPRSRMRPGLERR